MSLARARLLALAAYPLAPYLWLHGRALRRQAPRLGEATGPRLGTVPGDAHAVTIAVLGESTAAGVGVSRHEEGLAGQLASAVAHLTGRTIHWHVVAASGFTLRQMRRELLPLLIPLEPDAILLAAGVNDLVRLRSPAGYATQLERLILALRGKSESVVPIIVSPVPDLGHFPALSPLLRAVLGARALLYHKEASRLCRTLEAVVQLPQLPAGAYAPALFAADGFHPGPAGYRLWAELAARELSTLF